MPIGKAPHCDVICGAGPRYALSSLVHRRPNPCPIDCSRCKLAPLICHRSCRGRADGPARPQLQRSCYPCMPNDPVRYVAPVYRPPSEAELADLAGDRRAARGTAAPSAKCIPTRRRVSRPRLRRLTFGRLCYNAAMQYQTFRSVSDNHVFVVCLDGRFYEIVPDDVRKPGPVAGSAPR